MGFEMPVDVDYFDHPKTKRLMALLKSQEAAIYPLRLWAWAAQYAKTGVIEGGPRVIEGAAGWTGRPGRLLRALRTARYLEEDSKTLHDWMEGIGRAIAIYDEKKRKQRAKYALEHGILPEEKRKYSPYSGLAGAAGLTGVETPEQEPRTGAGKGIPAEQAPESHGSGTQTPTSPPPGPPSDPRLPLLEQANTRVGLRLLAAAAPDLGHDLKAHYASSIPLRELAAVCIEARTRKNPAGWLRKAIEARWRREAELAPETAAEVLAELGNGAPEAPLPRAYAPPRPRLEGETDDDYLRRVADLKKAEAKA